MFSEDNQTNIQKDQDITDLQKGSGPSTQLKDNLSINETEGTGAEAINQHGFQEIGEDSGHDFNHDDPIIAELSNKDWDEEFSKHRRSPNDKAAHFDIASSKPGNEEAEEASDGEDEATPIFNRFQSLQNLEEKEIQTNDR
ncbi:hypothetical protein Salat_2127700 [Sesamum alatum]|uniref:Uncharacterized protein n=1 Tax=Sesamum alatum TaxID=300844 RepID=A0AAE1Y1Y2_9LAMI|nr:hypothetical protein Salat_2127700 [Sesamum alatum]